MHSVTSDCPSAFWFVCVEIADIHCDTLVAKVYVWETALCLS